MEEVVKMLKNVIDQENEKMCQIMRETIQQLREEMNQKFDQVYQKINDLQEELKQDISDLQEQVEQNRGDLQEKMQHDMNNLYEKVNCNMNRVAKQILDHQFVFEEEYGRKIDAIFEYVEFHQKTNLKRFDRISDLEKRVEMMETHQLNYEKRISSLETNKI